MSDQARSDEDTQETLLEFIARRRREPPRRGECRKTLAELDEEQGVGPIDMEDLRANMPDPFYEGFEEDIRRMRRGLPPLGPRK